MLEPLDIMQSTPESIGHIIFEFLKFLRLLFLFPHWFKSWTPTPS